MGVIKRKGVPSNSVKGKVGDKYIDIVTGKVYVCVSAFKDSLGTAEYEWRYIPESVDMSADHEIPNVDNESPKNTEDKPEVEEKRERFKNNYHKNYKQNRK